MLIDQQTGHTDSLTLVLAGRVSRDTAPPGAHISAPAYPRNRFVLNNIRLAIRPLHPSRAELGGGNNGTRIHDRRGYRRHDVLTCRGNSGRRSDLRQSAVRVIRASSPTTQNSDAALGI